MKKLLCMPFLMALSCSLSVGAPTKSGSEPKLLEMYYNVYWYVLYDSGAIYVQNEQRDLEWTIKGDNFSYIKVNEYGVSQNQFFVYDTFYRLVEYKH